MTLISQERILREIEVLNKPSRKLLENVSWSLCTHSFVRVRKVCVLAQTNSFNNSSIHSNSLDGKFFNPLCVSSLRQSITSTVPSIGGRKRILQRLKKCHSWVRSNWSEHNNRELDVRLEVIDNDFVIPRRRWHVSKSSRLSHRTSERMERSTGDCRELFNTWM